jgi:hypothetical protein
MLLGDLLLAEPLTDFLDFSGFLLHLISLLLFTVALSAPTRAPKDVEAKTAASTTRPVPVNIHRAILPSALALCAILAWSLATQQSVADPRFIATACMSAAQALFVWRAAARLGYVCKSVQVGASSSALGATPAARFPHGSARTGAGASRDSPAGSDEDDDGDDGFGSAVHPPAGSLASLGRRRPAAASTAALSRALQAAQVPALESLTWQWCGALGAVAVAAGLLALGYDRFWLQDDPDADSTGGLVPSAVTVLYTLCLWLGQTLLVVSVPFALPQRASLVDPAVTPAPYEGSALRVALLLPDACAFDVSEVTVVWWTLRQRGHRVLFVTRDGAAGVEARGALPAPFASSLYGYGCAAGIAEAEAAAGEDGSSWGGAAHLSASAKRAAARRRQPQPQRSCTCCRCLLSVLHCRCICAGVGLLCCVSCPGCGSRRRAGRRSSRARRQGAAAADGSEDSDGDDAGWGSGAASQPRLDLGLGAPTDAVLAMYTALLADSSFRQPLAWSAAAQERAAAAGDALRARAHGGGPGSRMRAARAAGGSVALDDARGLRALRADAPSSRRMLQEFGHRGGADGADSLLPASPTSERVFVPESVDGLVVVGAYPAAAHDSLWDDAELRGTAARFFETEKPLACFGNAVLLLSRLQYAASGLSLLQGSMVTALPRQMERCHAWLHALCGCRWAGLCTRRRSRPRLAGAAEHHVDGGEGVYSAAPHPPHGLPAAAPYRSVEEEVTASLRMPALFVPAPPLLSARTLVSFAITGDFTPVRPADPFSAKGAVVVEDGRLLTAQCGGDAFALAQRFLAKLEVAQRAF